MANEIVVPFGELTKSLAERFEISPQELWATVKAQCFTNGAASDGQMMMLLSFAKQYDLNPLAREIYAFVSGGKMQVGVQVDGWTKIANREPDFDGQDMTIENDKDGNLVAITSTTYVKGRAHPTVYRAVLKEWTRATEVWKTMPQHQLWIKARNEGIRFAFGVSAYDEDDIQRISEARAAIEVQSSVADSRGSETNSTPLPQPSDTTSQAGDGTHTDDGAERNASEVSADSDAAGNRPPAETNGAAIVPELVAEEEPAKKRGRPPKDKRAKLDHLISQKVTEARLQLILGQYGVGDVKELNDDQVSALVSRLESR